jgi:hypothetical protein
MMLQFVKPKELTRPPRLCWKLAMAMLLKRLPRKAEELKKKLRKAEQDRDAMKKQSENLQEEYDRVCTQLNEAEVAI